MQLDVFNGNIAVPIDGRIGFGIPVIGSDEPTGPQLLATSGDPSGVVTAPVGALALDFGTPALWQNTDGATAWTLTGSTNIAATRTLWVDGNVTPAPTAPDGSINNPFPTIQAALDLAGIPVDQIDQVVAYEINIVGAIYDEDLTVPPFRSVNFIAHGLVFLTGNRNVTIDLTGVPPSPSTVTVSFDGRVNEEFQVTGQILLISTSANVLQLNLRECKVLGGGGLAIAGIDATGFTGGGKVELGFNRCFINGDSGDSIAAVLGAVELSSCVLTHFANAITADSWSNMTRCLFIGDVTFLVAPNHNGKAPARGWYGCNFDPGGITYTSVPAGGVGGGPDFDDATNFVWDQGGSVFAGAEVISLTSRTIAFQTDYATTAGPSWADPDPTNVRAALDRLAAQVATLSAFPVPV